MKPANVWFKPEGAEGVSISVQGVGGGGAIHVHSFSIEEPSYDMGPPGGHALADWLCECGARVSDAEAPL